MTKVTSFLSTCLRSCALFAVFSACAPAYAHDGHDDGAPAAVGAASPRITAHSDLFELVGIVDNGQMTVYLDRYANNEPVANAKIEFESGANKGVAAPQADGTYLIKFDGLTKTGELPFSFTVSAGADTDLLAADLVMPDHHEHEETQGRPWLGIAAWITAGLAGLALAIVLLRKFRPARRTQLLA